MACTWRGCSSRLQPRLLEARLTRARDRLEALGRRADGIIGAQHGAAPCALGAVAGRLSPQSIGDRVARCRERMGVLAARLRQTMLDGVARHRRHLDGCAKLLASLSYHGVLQRGFALVRDEAGRSVRSVGQIAAVSRSISSLPMATSERRRPCRCAATGQAVSRVPRLRRGVASR